jgi:hypothetical protein
LVQPKNIEENIEFCFMYVVRTHVLFPPLPLSTAMDNSEFDNSGDGDSDGDGGGGGGPAALRPATAAGEVVVGTFGGGGSVAAFDGGNSAMEYGEAMARGRCNLTVAVAGGYGD